MRIRETWAHRLADRGRTAVAAVLFGLLLAGCAGSGGSAVSDLTARRPGLAVLPFENLTDRSAAGDITTRVFHASLTAGEKFTIIEPGQVDSVLEAMRVRTPGVLSYAQIHELGQRLSARYLLMGSVLESGSVRTSDVEVPSLGIALRLLEAASGRVVWTAMKFRTGEDHELLFGWGRVFSEQRLTADLAEEMLESLPASPGELPERTAKGK